MISPINVLREAIKAVPALRYALGVGGLVATIAIIQTFKLDPWVAIAGTIILLILMGILVVFARMTSLAKTKLILPAMVFTWFTLLLFIIVSIVLFTSVFFNRPEISFLNKQSLNELMIDGTNIDIVYRYDRESREHAIGTMYETGTNVEKDEMKAAFWFKKGIEAGDSASMIDYAELLPKENMDEADELFFQAARLGNVRGLYKVGLYYRDFKEYDKARRYLSEAGAKGWPDAYAELGLLFESGKFGVQRVHESFDWYEKGVKEGSLQAMHYLGVTLFEGLGGKKDQHRAIDLLEEVATSDDYRDLSTVLWVLGNYYSTKESEVFDPIRAKKFYELAAEKGHPCARVDFVKYLLDEYPQNREKAIDILQAGIHDKQSQSILFFAERLLNGEGVIRDPQRAESLLKLGSSFQDTDSMLALADGYRKGSFGTINLVESAKYFSMAAQSGSSEAETRLKALMANGYQCKSST